MLILIPVSLVIAHEIRKRFGDYALLLLVFLCWLAYLVFSRPGG